MRIWSLHGHFGPFHGGYLPVAPMDKMRTSMARAGVKRLVMSAHDALFVDVEYGNQVVQSAVDAYPEQFLGYWAHGATYKGRKAGTLGDMAAFSLNGSKNLPGGEGGLFNTDSDELKRKADLVRVLGEDIQPGIERDYNAFVIGWMYRYQEMAAAFVRNRLRTLDQENEERRENAHYLSRKLSELPGIIPPYVPEDRTSVFHLYRIRFAPSALGLDVSPKEFRAKVQKTLRAEGVQANRWQNRPVPMQAVFQERKGYGQGCPWTCPYRSGTEVVYRLEDYPETRKLVDIRLSCTVRCIRLMEGSFWINM